MKAQSKVYVQLQNIYKAKARQDAAEVLETAQSIAPGRHFDAAEVELFCKNAPFVKLINATEGVESESSLGAADRLREVTGRSLHLPPRTLSPLRPAGQVVNRGPCGDGKERMSGNS